MKATVVQVPGCNRDRDMIAAITKIGGTAPQLAWHTDTELPESDLIVLPGGFSHGDYLRAGAIAARYPQDLVIDMTAVSPITSAYVPHNCQNLCTRNASS